MNENSFSKRHSLIIYFILTFTIAWMGSFVSIGPKFLTGEIIELSDIGPMALAMLSAPFISGLLMSYVSNGKPALNEIYAKLKSYKTGGQWYLPLLIFPALLLFVSVLLVVLVSPEFAPVFVTFGLFAGPLGGFFEELGWMGFAYPKMSVKASVLGASILLGIIHAFWHIVADFLGNYNTFGGYWPLYFFGFCLHIVALRVLIVWVYTNTGSLLLAILMHVSSTGFFGILISTTMKPQNWVIFYNVYGVLLCFVASIVAIKYGRTLKTKSLAY